MHFEAAMLGESSVTNITPEWLYPYVDEHMLFQVGRCGESRLAHLTLEWFPPCVGANVPFQGSRTGKHILTRLAFEFWYFLIVTPGETGHTHIVVELPLP